jgi:hypothetical protein
VFHIQYFRIQLCRAVDHSDTAGIVSVSVADQETHGSASFSEAETGFTSKPKARPVSASKVKSRILWSLRLELWKLTMELLDP